MITLFALLLGAASDVDDRWLQTIALPATSSSEFQVALELDGQPARLRLTRHSLRASNFRVEVADDATQSAVVPPEVATYRGSILGERNSVVLASIVDGALHATIDRGYGEVWKVRPLRRYAPASPHGQHIVARSGQFAELERTKLPPCGQQHAAVGAVSSGTPGNMGNEVDNGQVLGGGGGTSTPFCLKKAEIAFDADYEFYQAYGSSVAATVAIVESHLNEVDYFFARDARITYELTAIVVRTAPFYFPVDGGNLLDLFGAEWQSNQAHIPRDIAHLLTGKPGSLIQYGGLAWVGTVCSWGYMYGWSMDSAGIVGHELGHNWNAGHCHDVDPCNNMCGACLYIGPNTRDIIVAFRDRSTCLEDAGYATPLAPYTYPDSYSVGRNALAEQGYLELDVVGNDEDGNCHPLSLVGADTSTALGATVELLHGAGPGGRGLLRYTAPPTLLGVDSFTYLVADPGGASSVGTVTVDVHTEDLAGYWKLDDGAGTTALDTTANRRDGVFDGTPVWASGHASGALEFDGFNDSVAIPPLNLHTREMTMTAWIKRTGLQGRWRGLIFSRDADTVAGLGFGTSNNLSYHWNGASNTYNFSSGLTPPDGQWTFVALTVQADRATIWMDDGVLRSATNTVPHGVEEFNGELRLGWDPSSALRYFRGAMDDVRIYNYALDEDELRSVSALGGKAAGPRPVDGGKLLGTTTPLTWIQAPAAVAYEVYLGADEAAVRAASPASPEFAGTTSTPAYLPAPLPPGTTWFWRVDQHLSDGTVVRGDVWFFKVAAEHRWRLDELSGTVAADDLGTHDGDYLNSPLLGEPGASAQTGSSVRLYSNNERVRIHGLDLYDNRVTISGWFRRSGHQNPNTGLVFSRAASTVAGLCLGNSDTLRANWEGHVWDSGLLLPDNTWAFVALVVEPDRRTIYLGENGTLASAEYLAPHAPEEFNGNLLIGRDADTTLRCFDGWVDDVRFVDASLTLAQIQALYDATR